MIVLIGLVALTALTAACVTLVAPRIEARLGEATRAALADAGATQAALSGRDVTLTGTAATAADRVRAVEAAGRVPGVRLVRDQIQVGSPSASRAPAAPGRVRADSAGAESARVDSTAALAGSDQVAPSESTDATVRLAEVALREVLSTGRVEFETATARLTPDARAVLGRVAPVFVRYPSVAADIRGYTDSESGERSNRRLSIRRAEATRDYLATLGVAAERLAPRGFGEADPVGDNATEAGRARNRRVVFALRPL